MNEFGFSDKVPNLRLAWDSTCLSGYMKDPLTYYWKYCIGYRDYGDTLARDFGTVWHEATGCFEQIVFAGGSRDAALAQGLQLIIQRGQELGIPAAPERGGPSSKRNLRALVRALIWWEVDTRERAWRTATNADGTPAIEVRFLVPLGAYASTGEEYMVCGSFDGRIEVEGDFWTLERKTTAQTLGPYFWQTYDPCVQTYTYDYVSRLLYPAQKTRGVIVEGMQTGAEFARTDTHRIVRTDEQRLHWREVMLYWIRRAEQDALAGSWHHAMNPETSSFGSVYKDIQKRDPRVWDALLRTDLELKPLWNQSKML